MAEIQRFADLTAEQKAAFYEMRLLTRAVPNFAYYHVAQLARQTTIPLNEGVTVNWRKIAALSAATTPLSEGQTPDAQDVTITAVTATVEEYGAWIAFTEKLTKTGIDPFLLNAAEILGEQVGLTLDTLVKDIVVATTNVVRPGTHSAYSTITANLEDRMSATLILKALRTLRGANARPFDNGRYAGVISEDTEHDMLLDSTIQNIMQHVLPDGEANPLYNAYVGTIFGVDFFRSSNAKVYSSGGADSNDIHATMIFGRDSFGIGGLASMMPGKLRADQLGNNTGKSVKLVNLIVTPPETPSKDDPLRQRGAVGWKTTFVAKLLDENFLVKCEHGVSA